MFKLSVAFAAVGLVAGQSATLTAYCDALPAKCSAVHGITTPVCLRAFANIADGTAGESYVNSLSCRLKYLNDVAFNTTADACKYAGATGGGRCGSVANAVCSVAVTGCAGIAGASYTDAAVCGDSTNLGAMPAQWGSLQGSAAAGDDSLECRAYHALVGASQTAATDVHCSHFALAGGPCSGRVAPSVQHYCDTLFDGCSAAAVAQFGTKAQCLVAGAGYPNATAVDSGANRNNRANSLGCREYHAQAVRTLDTSHCEHAGPSGGTVCGSATEAWASIAAAAPCNDPHVKVFTTDVDPAIVAAAVPVGLTAAYSTSLDTSGNTQVCRIYHLGVATTAPAGPDGHCNHGRVSGGGACGTFRANLCNFIDATCGFGTNASWQFPDLAGCNSALGNITIDGTTVPQDVDKDSYECRFYHATVAATFRTGGKNAAVADAAYQRQFHCGHVLKVATAGGCGYVAPTAAPAPTAKPAAPTAAGKPSSAATVSMMGSMIVACAAVFAL